MPEQTLRGKVAVVGTGAKNLGGSDAFAIRRARELQAFYALDPNSFVKLMAKNGLPPVFFVNQLRERTHPFRAPVPPVHNEENQQSGVPPHGSRAAG